MKYIMSATLTAGLTLWPAAMSMAATSQIEEIVVVAQKRESNLQDTPIAVTALTADMIDERGIDAFRQIQHQAPNMVYNSLGGSTSLYLRGVGTDINDSLAEPGVALYIDGVYQGQTGDQSAIYSDLERIEVLRGPQGTLYGRNSTGGNVNIYTRDPTFEPSYNVSLMAGDYGRIKAAVGGTTGVVDELAAIRASIVVDQSDGYQDNPYDGKDIAERDLFSGAASLLLTPSESLEIILRGNYSERKDDTPRWDYIEVVPGSGLNPFMFGGMSAPGADEVANDGYTKYKTEIWGTSATINWDIGNVTLKSITAYRESDWSGPYDNDGTDIPFLHAHPTQTSEQFSQEFDLLGTSFDDRLEWIAGLYYFDQSSMAEYTYELAALQGLFEGAFGLPPGGLADPLLNPFYATRVNGDVSSAVPFTDFNTDQDTESVAVLAQGTWHFTDKLRGTLGGRFTDEKKDIVQTWRTNISPRGCEDLHQDESWNEVTWKVGLDYDQSEDMLLYGSVSRGFKAGGFNGGSCGNVYDPEILVAYEVGMKSVFADRRVQLNLAAFYYDYDDYQARLFIGGSAIIENAAEAELMGAEAEFVLRPLERLGVDGNISWLGGEFTQAESVNPMSPAAGVVDLDGNDMLRSPKLSYNLGIEYEFPLDRYGSLVPRYEVSYKDDYNNSIFNDDFMQMDSYVLQNFRVTWSNGSNLQVQAFIENLTDEEYLEALITSPSVGGTLGMWALPRTWGIKFSLDSF